MKRSLLLLASFPSSFSPVPGKTKTEAGSIIIIIIWVFSLFPFLHLVQVASGVPGTGISFQHTARDYSPPLYYSLLKKAYIYSLTRPCAALTAALWAPSCLVVYQFNCPSGYLPTHIVSAMRAEIQSEIEMQLDAQRSQLPHACVPEFYRISVLPSVQYVQGLYIFYSRIYLDKVYRTSSMV